MRTIVRLDGLPAQQYGVVAAMSRYSRRCSLSTAVSEQALQPRALANLAVAKIIQTFFRQCQILAVGAGTFVRLSDLS